MADRFDPTRLGGLIVRNPQAPAFTPAVVASLIGWWNPRDAASITASATLVSQWNDASSSGWNLTQGTGSHQPKTGTRTINGLNVLDFDGSDVISRAATTINQPFTIAMVVQLDSTANGQEPWGYGNATFRTNAGIWSIFQGGGNPGGGTPDTNAHLFIVVFNGLTSGIYMDSPSTNLIGSPDESTNGMTAINLGAQSDGATDPMDGALGDVAVWSSALNLTDRTTVYSGFRAIWGTP